jgi:hypothetical protein
VAEVTATTAFRFFVLGAGHYRVVGVDDERAGTGCHVGDGSEAVRLLGPGLRVNVALPRDAVDMATEVEPYPEEHARDKGRAVVDAAVAVVPIVGGAAETLLDALVTPKVTQRRDTWFATLGATVQELLDWKAGLEIDEMQQSDRLVNTILQTSEIALRTTEEEKLAALRAACIRAALPTEVGDVYERVFVRWIDELLPLHMQVLTYMEDPIGWFERNGIERQHYMGAARMAPFNVAMPKLAADGPLRDLVLRDLDQRGLADVGAMSALVSENAVFSPVVKDLGRKFLRFIRLPWTE